MIILYCDFGTYCDFSISKQVITRLLEKKNQVCYITSINNHLLKEEDNPLLQIYTYPSLPILDIVEFAQSKTIFSNLINPLTTVSTISRLSDQMKTFHIIVDIIKQKIKNIDAIVLTYPLLYVLKEIKQFVPEHVPIVLFYVAPAYPNLYLPWIFDNLLKDPEFALYHHKNKKENIYSHSRYNWIISLSSNWTKLFNFYNNDYLYHKKNLMERVHNLYIISAWNKDLIPPMLSPISVVKSHWFHINGIFENSSDPLPLVVQNFLKNPGFVVYITLGSMKLENMNSFVKVCYKAIQQQKIQMKLLIQDTKKQLHLKPKKDRLVFHGYIPYSSILSKTYLLITTGSYCIQHLALSFNVPMLFVPILTEQYFWAKNYQYHTNTPYIENVGSITYTKDEIQKVSNLISFIFEEKQKPNKLSSWLDQQYKNTRLKNGAKQFVSTLQKIITFH